MQDFELLLESCKALVLDLAYCYVDKDLSFNEERDFEFASVKTSH